MSSYSTFEGILRVPRTPTEMEKNLENEYFQLILS